ncbi:MAG: DUF72 domain-containing protein [Candidatus Levybacteria bacterium]|nr:DUF72 domain-containing protein [Candidatus Levybacteria bacterium]
MGNLYVGTSGYNYKHWKGIFYPENITQKEWLNYYSNYFNTVEINATFYRFFTKSVFEKWYNITPNNFKFGVKGPRLITHVKRLKDIEKELEIFLNSAVGLKNKLTNILWQLPKTFRDKDKKIGERFIHFLSMLPKGINNVFEFRDSSWFNYEIYSSLNKNKCGFVISDSEYFPTREVITDNIVYIRFHGPTKLYSSSYSNDELAIWAENIENCLRECDVYCYFNNDTNGFAVKNAQTLKSLIITTGLHPVSFRLI